MSVAERVFALRGAVQAERNDRESILAATDELLREMIARNDLAPERMISCLLTCTDDLNAEFPAVAARALGLSDVPLICTRELDVPGAMPLVIRAMLHYYAARRAPPITRLPRGRRRPALRHRLRPVGAPKMSIHFAAKLDALPHYEGGMDLERARRTYEASDVIKLASNESPWGPHPEVLEAVSRAAAGANRYPDQYASLLRRRLADRFEVEPGGIAVANGSCEILLAAALALCEPGAELIYAWPSFSMYPQLAPLSGAREIRVPLNERYEHDLEAILTEITVATQLVIVCNPNNPTGTALPVAEIEAFLERVPDHVTVILDEAYVEMQILDDPDSTVDLLPRFPNLVLLRTFSKVYGLAGLRCGYALGSARFRAAVDAVRQPFSVNLLSQAAGAEAIKHGDDVLDRVEKTIIERIEVEEELHDMGLRTAKTQTNFSWIDLGPNRDEAEIVEGLGRAGVIVRPGTPLGGPGHIRVSYGTAAENQRFLETLRGLI